MGDKWKREDIKKYKSENRPISWRCNSKFKGTGNEAKDLLHKVFVKLIKKEQLDRSELEQASWILGDGLQ